MRKRFIGQFVLALLMASSVLHVHGQSVILSDEDEAQILEWLVQSEIKPLGSEFGSVKTFSAENMSSVSASRLAKLGFSLMTAFDIQRYRQDHLIDYVAVRSIYLRDGMVVVRLSAVTEGRPCFAPAFSRERSFTYSFQKSEKGWVGRLIKRPSLLPFSRRSLATTP